MYFTTNTRVIFESGNNRTGMQRINLSKYTKLQPDYPFLLTTICLKSSIRKHGQ